MKKLFVLLPFAVIIMVTGCGEKQQEKKETKKETKVITENKLSADHLILATLWYQKSAEMQALYIQSYNWAKRIIDEKISKKSAKKPAVILDIDETVLDNSPFEANCIATGMGYSSESWNEWSAMMKATPLPGTIDFLNYAKSKGVEIFYITNRKTAEKEWTLTNMQQLNIPSADTAHILFRTDGSGKEPRRKMVAEKFDVILLIGDNLADFSELYENRDDQLAKNIVEKDKDKFGTEYIILPNPMYGEWENALYKYNKDLTEQQKDSIRRNALIGY
ncbi:MAG TPA: 5'-nucleotidase, lipoprotein e(P4) family [Bacteroidales bacterium]|nr:5'-nucleotidase, lipoprotein e(P4) family [Bacteroidales bacterium]